MVDVDDYGLQLTNSRIHSLNCVYKIISVLFVIFYLVLANSNMDMYMINLYLLVILLFSNISFRAVFKVVSLFFVFLFLELFVVSVFSLDLFLGFVWTLKVIDFIVYLFIIGVSTSYYDLVRGVKLLLIPFRKIFDIDELAINIGGFLKLFAILYTENERIINSKILRGVRFDLFDFVDRIDDNLRSMVPLFRYTFLKVDKFRCNVKIRKCGNDSFRANYRLNKWGKTDTILLIISVVMQFVLFLY